MVNRFGWSLAVSVLVMILMAFIPFAVSMQAQQFFLEDETISLSTTTIIRWSPEGDQVVTGHSGGVIVWDYDPLNLPCFVF
ncbi:MAG: hypothetical protein ACOYL5_10645 [Phototrophicaceae bacterium]|jgi:hypothetical protein